MYRFKLTEGVSRLTLNMLTILIKSTYTIKKNKLAATTK